MYFRFLITKGKRHWNYLLLDMLPGFLKSTEKIGLQDLVPMSLLCGNPSTMYDVDNPDWVPSVNMGYGTENKRVG